RLHQAVAGGEVAVEGADADTGLAGDILQRGVDAVLGEGGRGHGEQLVAVATRVGPQWALARHRRHPRPPRRARPAHLARPAHARIRSGWSTHLGSPGNNFGNSLARPEASSV